MHSKICLVMEKFTVDIEKILDDFEFNESQIEEKLQEESKKSNSEELRLQSVKNGPKYEGNPGLNNGYKLLERKETCDELCDSQAEKCQNDLKFEITNSLSYTSAKDGNSVQPDLLAPSSFKDSVCRESTSLENGLKFEKDNESCSNTIPDVAASSHIIYSKAESLKCEIVCPEISEIVVPYNESLGDSQKLDNQAEVIENIEQTLGQSGRANIFNFKGECELGEQELEEYFENLEIECKDVCSEETHKEHSIPDLALSSHNCTPTKENELSQLLDLNCAPGNDTMSPNTCLSGFMDRRTEFITSCEHSNDYSKTGARPKEPNYIHKSKIKSKSALNNDNNDCHAGSSSDLIETSADVKQNPVEKESSDSMCDIKVNDIEIGQSKVTSEENDDESTDEVEEQESTKDFPTDNIDVVPQRPTSLDISSNAIPEIGNSQTNISSSSSPTSSNSSLNYPIPVDSAETCENSLSEEERTLGLVAPYWVPDKDAPFCMHCEGKFTMIKRRHHCRACGKVFCSGCCSTKSEIPYLETVARVCSSCAVILSRVNSLRSKSDGHCVQGNFYSNSPGGCSPNPSNPLEYCSTVPPLEQAALNKNILPPTVMVPVGVLKREEIAIQKVEASDQRGLIDKMKDEVSQPVVFVLNPNLFVHVKILNLTCCVGKPHWCFSTRGMCTAGQDEILILLQCNDEETSVPRDIFAHLSNVYNEAFQGNPVNHMGHTLFTGPFLGSRDHGGFLYIRPTFQCLQNLLLPSSPFLVGVLLQKWETPWAKVFPIRLMLRLGAEFRYYPCPLFSVRDRRPVYCEVGHTIMNLLADFRNFAYMLSTVPGMIIHMEDKKTSVLIPRNRYRSMMKALANSNDYVLALGSNFSVQADSHLVCIQKEDGNYVTQAINIQNKPRIVTGASFIVFNGALKSSSGLTAKSSIVEDGMMIQFPPEVMSTLQTALREMNDFEMGCGPVGAKVPDEMVVVQWVEDDKSFNIGVRSPIDDRSLEGVPSMKIKPSNDLMTGRYHIKWTEVFLIQAEDNVKYEPVDISKVSESLCISFCNAISAFTDSLRHKDLCHIGLRVFIDLDSVSYEVGCGGSPLPSEYMINMDSELIPVIHEATSNAVGGPTILELIFYILNPQ